MGERKLSRNKAIPTVWSELVISCEEQIFLAPFPRIHSHKTTRLAQNNPSCGSSMKMFACRGSRAHVVLQERLPGAESVSWRRLVWYLLTTFLPPPHSSIMSNSPADFLQHSSAGTQKNFFANCPWTMRQAFLWNVPSTYFQTTLVGVSDTCSQINMREKKDWTYRGLAVAVDMKNLSSLAAN